MLVIKTLIDSSTEKKELSNCSCTYIDHKTCNKNNLHNCYVHACTQPYLVILSLVRVTPGMYRAPFLGALSKRNYYFSNQSIFKLKASTEPPQFALS